MSAFSTIDLRMVAAMQPYFVYHRYLLNTPRVYSLYSVPYGFNYLLRSVFARWDGLGTVTTDPPLRAEIFNSASSRARQNTPVSLALVSSPGGETTTAVEPGAPFNISFTALGRTSSRLVNLAFPYGDTIRMEITGQIPGYTAVDIVLQGYLIAETALSMWGGDRADN